MQMDILPDVLASGHAILVTNGFKPVIILYIAKLAYTFLNSIVICGTNQLLMAIVQFLTIELMIYKVYTYLEYIP